MAPANTPGRKKRDNQANYFKVGVQGRLVLRLAISIEIRLSVIYLASLNTNEHINPGKLGLL